MKKKVSPGFVLFMMLMSMVAGAVCLNKVAPIIPSLTLSMGLTATWQAGLLVSIFVFSGIFLALPSGMVIARFGYYRTGAFALAVLLVGSAIGALNLGYGVMLISRIIEGLGLILLMTVGPAATASVFDGPRRGAAMGVLMCFMPIGQVVMFNLAPRIANWELIWWGTAAYAGLFLIIWLFSLRNLDASLTAHEHGADAEGVPAEGARGKKSLLPREVLGNGGVWLMGLSLLFYLITSQAVMAFLPTFLSEVRGMDPAVAGSTVSIAPLVGLPLGVITGIISDKVGSRKWPLGILLVASAVVYALIPGFPTALFLVLVIFFGVVAMGVVGLCFSAAAELVETRHGGVVVGMLNVFQWVGIFLSGSLGGLFVEWLGWSATFYLLAPLSVLGALCAWVTPRLR
ncbi:MAG: MFS transporter [Coriobacteriales bacterium]|jgi:MFS family permease|nr:MFS transporter [Coriobacteriales bacterium]